jgi:Asp/Glu/Hydantoin racemase
VTGKTTVVDALDEASLRRPAAAGVDFAAMTANTPHVVFDELAARSPVPLVSIVEVCAEEARRPTLSRLVLLGARVTMEAPFYPAVCARYGVLAGHHQVRRGRSELLPNFRGPGAPERRCERGPVWGRCLGPHEAGVRRRRFSGCYRNARRCG